MKVSQLKIKYLYQKLQTRPKMKKIHIWIFSMCNEISTRLNFQCHASKCLGSELNPSSYQVQEPYKNIFPNAIHGAVDNVVGCREYWLLSRARLDLWNFARVPMGSLGPGWPPSFFLGKLQVLSPVRALSRLFCHAFVAGFTYLSCFFFFSLRKCYTNQEKTMFL